MADEKIYRKDIEYFVVVEKGRPYCAYYPSQFNEYFDPLENGSFRGLLMIFSEEDDSLISMHSTRKSEREGLIAEFREWMKKRSN